MVILLYVILFCYFIRIGAQSKQFCGGLGACPWRTFTDAMDLYIYRCPWPLETHFHRALFWTLLWHKDDAQNVSKHDQRCYPIFFSEANCSQKKRGAWAQKGKDSHYILIQYASISSKFHLGNKCLHDLLWVISNGLMFFCRLWNLWWKKGGAPVSTTASTTWKVSYSPSLAEM